MKNKIIISPIFDKYFAGRVWMGLNIDVIKEHFVNKGVECEIIPFEKLIDSLDTIKQGSTLFYSSIYNETYLQYIKDIILTIKLIRPDLVVLPNYEQLNSLENKGFQECYKKHLGIEKVGGKYYGDAEDFFKDEDKIAYPFVLKKNKGALSSGVSLIHNQKEMKIFIKKEKRKNLKERIAFKLNKRNSFQKDANLFPEKHLLERNFESFFQKRFSFVTQEFIPNLECDYKILIFGDKYYCLQRKTRSNDFRASGSGNFSFIDPPIQVLDFAKNINGLFKTPFISLDIGIDANNQCYLFEYQGTGFGPMTLTQSTYYFGKQNDEWVKTNEIPNLEKEYANAITYFLKNYSNENS